MLQTMDDGFTGRPSLTFDTCATYTAFQNYVDVHCGMQTDLQLEQLAIAIY